MIEENFDKEDFLVPISGMYKEWFIDYASYVILERAVPSIEDGLLSLIHISEPTRH